MMTEAEEEQFEAKFEALAGMPSIVITPPMPIKASKMPASTGATIVVVESASETKPLARPYCALGTIRLIAAEKAGNWNASNAPAKAPAT